MSNDLSPDVLEILDSKVIGQITPVQGGVINVVEHIVSAFDGGVYTCFSQSQYKDGKKTVSAFYGFNLLQNDDTQPIITIAKAAM